MLGGTQSLHTNSFDEAIALPTDFSRAHRPQHAADPRRGKRRHRGRRSARRQLVRREADPRAGGESLGADRGGRGARRHDQGGRRRAAQAPHRGSRRGARGEGRYRRDGDRRRQPLPAGRGGRASTSSRSTMPRSAPGRSRGSRRCARRATRRRCGRRWMRWSKARAATQICSRLSVEAARARCTLGEISDALERAFGRYGTKPEPVRGIYGKARRDGRWKARRRGHAIGRRPARPQAADHGRQDGPGRPRPRRQPGVVGLHRSRLRSDPRPAVPDPARDRANGDRATTSTWSAQARSPRATARSSRR